MSEEDTLNQNNNSPVTEQPVMNHCRSEFKILFSKVICLLHIYDDFYDTILK